MLHCPHQNFCCAEPLRLLNRRHQLIGRCTTGNVLIQTVSVQSLAAPSNTNAVCGTRTLQHSCIQQAITAKAACRQQIRMRPVKCYIWGTAVCGAEEWMLRKLDQKYLESFEMCCWRSGEDQLDRPCEK